MNLSAADDDTAQPFAQVSAQTAPRVPTASQAKASGLVSTRQLSRLALVDGTMQRG